MKVVIPWVLALGILVAFVVTIADYTAAEKSPQPETVAVSVVSGMKQIEAQQASINQKLEVLLVIEQRRLAEESK